MMNRKDAYQWGRDAEQIAVEYLEREGYVVRERNWRQGASHKEIDIIAQKATTMVFVEVKARRSDDIDPVDAVDKKKINFLCRGADSYLRSQPHDFDFRFDIIAITGNIDDYTLTHLEDAFMPPLTTR